MSNPLTDAEIAELRKLDAAATPPTWDHPGAQEIWTGRDTYLAFVQKTADADLVAAARNALPALLDEVTRARALLRRIEWAGGRSGECPACAADPGGGETSHRPGCDLAALIGAR